jgi:hypothetical protein
MWLPSPASGTSRKVAPLLRGGNDKRLRERTEKVRRSYFWGKQSTFSIARCSRDEFLFDSRIRRIDPHQRTLAPGVLMAKMDLGSFLMLTKDRQKGDF